jgi:ketosteroid isomerase-like protein
MTQMNMTYERMMAFAEQWIANWNRRDIEAVLVHFADDAQFISPLAGEFVGRCVLRSKDELRVYWQTGLTQVSALEFTLDHASWDERRRALTVVYQANLNGERKRACEVMQFDPSAAKSAARPSTARQTMTARAKAGCPASRP